MSLEHVVVVLNWYGRADTIACVDSLQGAEDLDVLVVDNGSYDGALEAVTGLDRVHRLQLSKNFGFAGGMNRGIEEALARGAQTITILNNDTVVPPGTLSRLRQIAVDGRAVSPTVVYRDEPERIWFAEGSLDMPDGYPHHTDVTMLAPCRGGIRNSALLAGCCITASAKTWQQVGLFDERFFLNFEDSEWSVRARSRGIELVVACEERILHAVSASFQGPAATLGSFYFLRNGLLFTRIVGAGLAARVRFVVRFGLMGLRKGSWQQRRRRLIVLWWAVMTHLRGRYGEAPRGMRRWADRWSRADRGQPIV